MATRKTKTKKESNRKSHPKKTGLSVVTLSLKLEAALRKDGNEWVAWCIPLDIFSQGSSKSEAFTSLEEAVHLWFESCIERNVVDKALADSGFYKLGPGEAVPRGASLIKMKREPEKANAHSFSAHDYIEVSIPAYIAAQHSLNLRATH
ncbi:MAG: type II toxin-antitoxin system HicB family antitoxin [Acidobacteriota bacterium]|nr:type II toxin-antitoxin system HicB family antitoxin [Acidobacteriota bacterium]